MAKRREKLMAWCVWCCIRGGVRPHPPLSVSPLSPPPPHLLLLLTSRPPSQDPREGEGARGSGSFANPTDSVARGWGRGRAVSDPTARLPVPLVPHRRL
eukprot:1839631-Rhodomonas_salina.1